MKVSIKTLEKSTTIRTIPPSIKFAKLSCIPQYFSLDKLHEMKGRKVAHAADIRKQYWYSPLG